MNNHPLLKRRNGKLGGNLPKSRKSATQHQQARHPASKQDSQQAETYPKLHLEQDRVTQLENIIIDKNKQISELSLEIKTLHSLQKRQDKAYFLLNQQQLAYPQLLDSLRIELKALKLHNSKLSERIFLEERNSRDLHAELVSVRDKYRQCKLDYGSLLGPGNTGRISTNESRFDKQIKRSTPVSKKADPLKTRRNSQQEPESNNPSQDPDHSERSLPIVPSPSPVPEIAPTLDHSQKSSKQSIFKPNFGIKVTTDHQPNPTNSELVPAHVDAATTVYNPTEVLDKPTDYRARPIFLSPAAADIPGKTAENPPPPKVFSFAPPRPPIVEPSSYSPSFSVSNAPRAGRRHLV